MTSASVALMPTIGMAPRAADVRRLAEGSAGTRQISEKFAHSYRPVKNRQLRTP
ncbi:hypothetical protein WKI65_23080 [Streptomyces sp. MS1.AVA.3]|uniref:hypothetical protein n=1 Tax=Streptomyces decoyicus TaxID=249567 RepID=UPI0030BADDC7